MNDDKNNMANGANGANGTYGAHGAYGADKPYKAYGAHEAHGANRANGVTAGKPVLEPQPFLPKKGNYQGLASYKKATVIYDLTFYFAKQFLSKGDRTIDQMVQAARSGKQNIAEGCAAAATSAETELKLVNVARASMKELLVDYEDYLRVRNLVQWSFNDERTRNTREFCKKHEASDDFMRDIDRRSDETIANIAITLLHQFDNIIGAYIAHLEKTFVEQGGIRERMTAARLGYRNEQKAHIAELEAENTALKARVAELEALLGQKGGGQ